MRNPIDAITQEKLIASARAIATDRGWTWRDPVDITVGFEGGAPVWILRSNAEARSPSVRIVFRQTDLFVFRSGYLPR